MEPAAGYGGMKLLGKGLRRNSAVALLCAAVIAIALGACSSDGADSSEVMSCPAIEPPGPLPDSPPALPYIFQGNYYIDGEPGPGGVKIWAQMARSRSNPSETFDDGRYFNVIVGPLHPDDYDTPFVFCIGEPDGDSVMASSTPIPYEQKGTFHTLEDLRVDFPRLP